MNEQPEKPQFKRPTGLAVIAIINGIAFTITLLFWGVVFFRNLVPLPGSLTISAERANAATTYGFLIGDIVWSAPLLLLATIGIWRPRPWGWTSAQMVNALWVYSMTVIWMRDAYTAISPGALLFTPFALIAVWGTYYLWKHRNLFWEADLTS
jgi:hypothetical protein